MTKKAACLLLFFPTLIILSCAGNPQPKSQPESLAPTENTITDFYHFKHLLPESDLAYDIEITDIKLFSYKNAFTITKEKFDVPQQVDGRTVSVAFNITNPYPREMLAPFPDYFQITAKEFDDLNMYGYSKSYGCNTSSSTEITNSKGDPLSSFSRYSDDLIGRQLLVQFKANETKSIIVNFKDPFHSTTKTITFIGFNKHLKKTVDDFYKLTEEEQTKYIADRPIEYGLVIDLVEKKIVGLTEYKR